MLIYERQVYNDISSETYETGTDITIRGNDEGELEMTISGIYKDRLVTLAVFHPEDLGCDLLNFVAEYNKKLEEGGYYV